MFRRVIITVLVAAASVLFAAGPAQAFPATACDRTAGPEGRPGDYKDYTSPLDRTVWTHNMYACQWLDNGKSWTFYKGTATLRMVNGDLGVYNKAGVRKWHTNTAGSGATQMLWQQDGNLVLYTSGYGRAVWASNTANKCDRYSEFPILATQSDNNLVIYCGIAGTKAIWATHTNGI
ncbi:hypothetical protein [Cryptosporangium japonicum]|uniref:Bulb-type lectin domain-containing protein n=1 Tax=Cryptosporangium japonicum TaxID=80872 RepID=A0ABP3DP78_9ACTN